MVDPIILKVNEDPRKGYGFQCEKCRVLGPKVSLVRYYKLISWLCDDCLNDLNKRITDKKRKKERKELQLKKIKPLTDFLK